MKDAIFLGFNFQQFSDSVSVGIFLLFAFTIIFKILYLLKNKFILNLVNKFIFKQI